jgi:hypothetical protein
MKVKKEDLVDDGRWQYDEDLGFVRSGPRGNRYWDELNQHEDTDPIASLNAIARLNTGIDPDAKPDHQRTQSRHQKVPDFANNPYLDPRRPTQEERLRYRHSQSVRSRALEIHDHGQDFTSVRRRHDTSSHQDVGSTPNSSKQSPPEEVTSNVRTSPDFFELPAPIPEPQGRPQRSIWPELDRPTPDGNHQQPPLPAPPPAPAGCICPIHLDCDDRDPDHVDCRQLVPLYLYKRWQAAQAQFNPWP